MNLKPYPIYLLTNNVTTYLNFCISAIHPTPFIFLCNEKVKANLKRASM